MAQRDWYPYREVALRAWATGAVEGGRLAAKARVRIEDLSDPNMFKSENVPFALFGAGDVAGLAPGAITRRFPAPGSSDAEETKAALVELSPVDLPWRYTPESAPANHQLKPWIAVVVGTHAEMALAPRGRVAIKAGALKEHPLEQSWRWAHVHKEQGHDPFGRICSPRDLKEEGIAYLACVVPTFAVSDAGVVTAAWSGNEDVTLPCYDHWTFTTGPAGDFPQLAGKIGAADYDSLGPTFGVAEVRYDRRAAAPPPPTFTLNMEGALARVPHANPAQENPQVVAAHGPVHEDVADEVTRLTDPPSAAVAGRWLLSAPRYQEPWVGSAPVAAPGWPHELVADPRRRAAAGLGAETAIAWQDRISAAAGQKTGDLLIAQDRVAHLGLGLEVARSLWRRRVPADPVARLAVLGPVLGRLPEKSYGTAVAAVASRGRMTRALWSSAARRALRPGPARTARAAPGAASWDAVITVASRCPKPPRPPKRIKPQAAIKAAVLRAARVDSADSDDERGRRLDLVGFVMDNLPAQPSPDLLAAVLVALDPGGGQPPATIDAVSQLLDGAPHAPLPARPERDPQRPDCVPLDPAALGVIIGDAVDPTVDRPIVVARVLATINPSPKDLRPIQLEPELDLPLWSFLSTERPDWMLPGVGLMAQHSVVAMTTNPGFVESLVVGANVQAAAELRWRRHPLGAKATPLRKFWQRPGSVYDVSPIKGWPVAAPFGDPALRDTARGSEAVVVFRTPLFKRYPSTVVYMYPADANWKSDRLKTIEQAQCAFPSFTGTIGPDVVFFGFPLPPAAFADHWIILEEPPSGYRFYTEDPFPEIGNDQLGVAADAGVAAFDTFAVPIRVAIGRLLQGVL